ncbi:hypothetical protein [Bacillus sp. MB2021]|uniref:hypothetical protein n=1 Tax=Bacillus sp. MB2021 TaxID=1408303 RepID=UPI0004E254B6|nr:hypothetical protein [Bacillus sp. MB2021]
MNKGFEQEMDTDIAELAEEVLSLEDELELDNDIRKWLQTPPVQLQEYGYEEANREEEYFAKLNEISEYLMER